MSSNAPSLTRTLGLWQVTISGVGIVIGAGIYVLIGDATALAGSLVWASFVIAALLAAFTGLSYAELAGLFPSAGAESEFARRAFNEFWGFLAGWLMVIGNVVGAGAVALGFARYLQQFVAIDMRVGAIGLLVVLTMIVAGGIRRSIWFSTALVLLQVGGLLMVIWVGLPHIGTRDLTDGTTTGVLSAAALVFFAFIGFDEVVTLSDETRDAHRTIPRALLLALGISTALYLAVGVAAVSVIDWHDLAASDRPLGLVLSHVTGSYGSDILAAIALASTTNTTLLLLTAASRLLFNMSQRGRLPAALSTVGARTKAPQVAAIVACVGAIPLALTQQLGLVA
ncbi:MAG: amino acid permease, partial [Chloroflexota bacterium]